jgi:hypothetical protein
MTGNGIDGVGVRGLPQGEHTWQAIGYPYVIDQSISVPANSVLTIEPGVEVQSTQDSAFGIRGRLVAVGTEEAPIRFTGTRQKPGWWHGIHLTDDATVSEVGSTASSSTSAAATSATRKSIFSRWSPWPEGYATTVRFSRPLHSLHWRRWRHGSCTR